MERAIVFVAEASVFEGVLMGLCRMSCPTRFEGYELALLNEALIEEGGK